MASGAYLKAKHAFLSPGQSLTGVTIKAMLVQTGYVPDFAAHQYVSDITGGATNYEMNSGGTGSGYAAGFSGSGRKSLTTLAVNENTGGIYAYWSADNLTWSAINAGTARAVVFYLNGTSDSDSKLLFYIQFPADTITNGGNLVISWNAAGIVQLT